MIFDFENRHIVALKCLKNLCQIANCCQTVRKVERAKQESKQNLGSNGQTFVENTCTYFLAIRILDIILAWVVLDTALCNRQMVDLGGHKLVVCGMAVDTGLAKSLVDMGFDNDVFCKDCKNLIDLVCVQNNLDNLVQNWVGQSQKVPMAQIQNCFVDMLP
mgnify:CR=1 FL=1